MSLLILHLLRRLGQVPHWRRRPWDANLPPLRGRQYVDAFGILLTSLCSPFPLPVGVKDFPDEPYPIESTTTTLQLELRFAKSVRFFKMANVSNSAFTDVRYGHLLVAHTLANLWPFQHEFGRLARQLEFEKLHLPTSSAAAKIKANLDKHKDFILTEVR